jgi:hypothetical protein
LIWQKRKKEKVEPSTQEAVSRMGPGLLRLSWDTVFSLFIIGVIALALWQSRHFDLRTGLFPWAIGFPILSLTVSQLVMECLGRGSRKSEDHLEEAGPHLPPDVVNRRTAGMFGWILGYFCAIWLFGFSYGVPLCTFLQLKIFGREKWFLSLIYTAFAWALIYGIFDRVLHVPFPQGQLFVWLKLPPV